MTPSSTTNHCYKLTHKFEKFLENLFAKRLASQSIVKFLVFLLLGYEVSIFLNTQDNDYATLVTKYLFIFSCITLFYSLFLRSFNYAYAATSLLSLVLLNVGAAFSLLFYISLHIVLAIAAIKLTRNISKKLSFVILGCLLSITLLVWTYFKFMSAEPTENYFPFHVRGLLFIYIPLVYATFKGKELIKPLLFPFNWLLVVPIRRDEWNDPSKSNEKTSSGIVDILIGSQALFLLYKFKLLFVFYFTGSGLLEFLIFGTNIYLNFYLLSLGFASLFIGCGKILGYSWQKPFHYPFLAHNPAEHWRRWNMQYFQFFTAYAYLPMMRSSKNLFLSIMAAFLLSTFAHVEISSYTEITPYYLFNFIIGMILFFILHGFAVYSGLQFKTLWGHKDKHSGWRGVFLTHLIMITVHGLRFITL